MSVWRFTAAAAAFCFLASSSSALATAEKSPDTSAHYKKHRVSSEHKLPKAATRRKSHRLARHRGSDRTSSLQHRRARHIVRRMQTPHTEFTRDFSGTASFYWEGDRVATGARYNPDGLTAAHRTLPFGTQLRVTDLVSNRSVVVTINDRGPFIAGRVLDLSRGAARVLGMMDRGVTRIHASVI